MLQPSPMAQDEALRALGYIRAAIDRTTRYSTFSALSGFLAGAAALAGSGFCGLWAHPGADPGAGRAFLLVWSGVFAAAAASLGVLTALKARQRGEALWTPIARTALSALLGPGLAGAAATAALVHAGRYELLPGAWLTLYGCGLYAASFFAPLFLRARGCWGCCWGWRRGWPRTRTRRCGWGWVSAGCTSPSGRSCS
ncbi:MAG: hypothetical protein M5U26_23725 [Planctomycetota bacterium]|nr:hypothetical protein [Planctomycetota bacterium]